MPFCCPVHSVSSLELELVQLPVKCFDIRWKRKKKKFRGVLSGLFGQIAKKSSLLWLLIWACKRERKGTRIWRNTGPDFACLCKAVTLRPIKPRRTRSHFSGEQPNPVCIAPEEPWEHHSGNWWWRVKLRSSLGSISRTSFALGQLHLEQLLEGRAPSLQASHCAEPLPLIVLSTCHCRKALFAPCVAEFSAVRWTRPSQAPWPLKIYGSCQFLYLPDAPSTWDSSLSFCKLKDYCDPPLEIAELWQRAVPCKFR